MADNLTPAERARQDEEEQAWADHEWRKSLTPADWQAEHDRWRKQLVPFAVRDDGTTVLLDPTRPLVTGGTGSGKSSDAARRWAEEAAYVTTYRQAAARDASSRRPRR